MKSFCGARRFDKYKCTADKPSNQVLHKENEKKLNDLLRIREEQDNRVFPPISFSNDATKNSTITESFAMPSYAPLGPILYYPTSDVKEKKD
jgi:hypothetical protein